MKIAFIKSPVGGIIGLEMIAFTEPPRLECVAAVLPAKLLLVALLSGKVTIKALKNGMNLAKVFSKSETFLKGHIESKKRIKEWNQYE